MSLRKTYKSLIIVLSILFVMSCNRDDGSLAREEPLERASEMAKLYNGEFSKNSIKFSHGEATDVKGAITNTTNGSVAVFTFQRGENDAFPSNLPDGDYEVLYMRHFLVLSNQESGKKFILIVSKQESTDLLTKLPLSYTKNTEIISGYGLSMNYTAGAGARPFDCASAGGSGATSCSNTCCSVSCGAGYQAACGSTCRCDRKT